MTGWRNQVEGRVVKEIKRSRIAQREGESASLLLIRMDNGDRKLRSRILSLVGYVFVTSMLDGERNARNH